MNKVYGYCRISTTKQKIDRQVDNIKKEYPDAVIIEEAYTGTTTDRPKFTCLLKKVESGDTIVFDEVSRMSRNASEGAALYEDLYRKGISLVFLKEPGINTEVYRETLNSKIQMTGTDVDIILKAVDEYLITLAKKQIEIAFASAQAEVDHLHDRTSEGVKKAKERYERETVLGIEHEKNLPGRATGTKVETKKAAAVKEVILKHSEDFNGTLTDAEVIKLAGCSRNSYYKYKKELRNG